jgi:hypothetical protein
MTPCMMVTSSFGTLTPCSEFDEASSAAHRMDENAMPSGWLRPSSAMAMPVKPMPVGKFREYEPAVPLSSSGMPTRPATAPEMSIADTTIFFTLMPLATAADSLNPVARMENPNTVRKRMNA